MSNLTTILTHRGLDLSKNKDDNYFSESSLEAFTDQINRGYGLEFDIRITKDNKFIIIHDDNLLRLTTNKDSRLIKDINLEELLEININGSHLVSLSQLLDLIENISATSVISALHLKYTVQDLKYLDLLVKELESRDLSKFIVFDVLKETAIYLKKSLPNIRLAPSVAHSYDIERYNSAVGGTLWDIKDVLDNKNLFYAVWLDEWDTLNKNGSNKIFYNQETFNAFRSVGLKIFLVTPELHSTSPGLYGEESHKDAINEETLMSRIKQIIALKPDSVCTDYPYRVRDLLSL
ncbi:MAG: glycerophosphoryl diester phosphodiesterase [Patescibacteria group bacterium]|nr:glycerophosphoryl diester phosphodiesterase [Patescibacteria group bacterium]